MRLFSRRRAPDKRKPIDLALQGGGAHGAFTWGVLDRLLEDGRLLPDGVSGTSAGAVNAVALAAGLSEGGAEGARRKLEEMWRAVSEAARFSVPPAAVRAGAYRGERQHPFPLRRVRPDVAAVLSIPAQSPQL